MKFPVFHCILFPFSEETNEICGKSFWRHKLPVAVDSNGKAAMINGSFLVTRQFCFPDFSRL